MNQNALLLLATAVRIGPLAEIKWTRMPRLDYAHGAYRPEHYLLQGVNWKWAFTDIQDRKFEMWPLTPDGYITVPGILSVGDAEAFGMALSVVLRTENNGVEPPK